MVQRLLSHEKKRRESIEKARKIKQEEEEKKALELKKMHKTKKESNEVKQCFTRLADDAKVRDIKLEEAKNKKSEEFEEELKTLFRPRLVSNQSGVNLNGTMSNRSNNSKTPTNKLVLNKPESPEPTASMKNHIQSINQQVLSNYRSTDALLKLSMKPATSTTNFNSN